MSQAYGRMYHPTPHHHHHHQGPPFRQAGEIPHHQGYPSHRGYHQNPYSPSRSTPSHSYNNSVSVYSVPKPSRPYNNYNNRRGRGGAGRGAYHNSHHSNHQGYSNHPGYNNHSHNNYRSHPPDFDLEWDHYDFNADGPSGQRGGRQKNSRFNQGSGTTLNDAELEWDDYDLRPKEEEEDTADSLDYVLTEGVFPLIGVVTKASLSRGHIPLGAIQVCRFPHGRSFKAFASPDHFAKSLRLNKDLLVLTSELKEGALLTGLNSPSESKNFLLSDLALTRNKDSSSSLTDTPSKESESEGASNDISEEDLDEDLLNDTYESGYQDRLGDIDLYALAPHDFDSPDSIFSRSLADLTDISLYEELGLDPSLVRAGLERTRSLGDATRAQDVSKDKAIKGVKNKKRKRKGSEKVEETATGAGDEGNEKKTKRLAPNFFVAVQVSNPQIHEALKDVQQTVVSGDEKLKDAMVPIATLHLTIMVMHLATEEDIERAKEALNECHRLLSPRFEKEKLNILFGGLGHFNNQVMFAKIKDQDNILETLYEIADTVEKCFCDYNLVSTGERGFKPHLTVMKLSRAPSLRKKGVRRIKSELYKAHSNQVFGMQVLEGLQLCSINKPKTAEGYYCKAAEVLFGESACRPDRDIHTIAETDEPSLVDSSLIKDSSPEPSEAKHAVNGTLGPEEPMDINSSESSIDKAAEHPQKNNLTTDGYRNEDSDIEQLPNAVCDSAVNREESISTSVEGNGNQCGTFSNTSSGTTHHNPSDSAQIQTSNISQGKPCITSNGTTPEEQLNQLNSEKPSRPPSIQHKSTCGPVVNGCSGGESVAGNVEETVCKTGTADSAESSEKVIN